MYFWMSRALGPLVTLLMLLAACLLPPPAGAAGPTPIATLAPEPDLDAEMLRLRAYHENIVVETLRAELGNFLERDAYNVSATVTLKPVPANNLPPAPPSTSSPGSASPAAAIPVTASKGIGLPDDFTLGRLDLNRVLALSRNPAAFANRGALAQVNAPTQAGAPTNLPPVERFALETVRLVVGLNERITAEVRTQVEAWVRQRIRERYGNQGSILVQTIRELAPKVSPDAAAERSPAAATPSPTPEAARAEAAALPLWAQNAALFQNLIGLMAVGILGLLGLLLMARAASRSTSKSRGKIELDTSKATLQGAAPAPPPSFAPPMQSIAAAQVAGAGDKGGRGAATESAETAARLAPSLKETSNKIRDILTNMKDRVGSLIETWSRAGEEGEIKIACLLEAAADGATPIPLPKDGDQALASRLRDGFRKIAEMDPATRMAILNDVYWEIVAARSLGSGNFDRPFKYLERMEQAAMSGLILDAGNSRLSAMVALQMPDTSRRGFLRGLTRDARLNLLRGALGLGEFSQEEVQGFDQELRSKFETGAAGNRGKLNALPLIPRVLSSLGSYEEASLIHELDSTNTVGTELLRTQHASVGFLAQWNDAALPEFCASLGANEIVAILRLIPEIENRALVQCSPLVLEIVTDELRRQDVSPEMEKNQMFDQIRIKIMEYVSIKGVPLSEIVTGPGTGAAVPPAALEAA